MRERAAIPRPGLNAQLSNLIVTLTPEGKMLQGNRAAWYILREGQCFYLDEAERLRARPDPLRQTLDELILRASEKPLRYCVSCETPPDQRLRRWSVGARRMRADHGEDTVVLNARELSAHDPITPEEAERLIGLTRAEAQLTVRLAAGDTLESIAEERGVHLSTIRAQLRSVYAKTHTNRQAELVAHVWRLAAG